jgi:hypothetical protein
MILPFGLIATKRRGRAVERLGDTGDGPGPSGTSSNKGIDAVAGVIQDVGGSMATANSTISAGDVKRQPTRFIPALSRE